MNNFDIDGWLSRTSEEPWSSNNISNLLDVNVLEKVAEKWNILEVSTKLKLIFSFFMLKPENKSKIKDQLSKVIELGKKDEESEWVQVISEFFTNFAYGDKIETEIDNIGFKTTFEKLNNAIMENGLSFNTPEIIYLHPNIADKHKVVSEIQHFTLKETAIAKPPELPNARKKQTVQIIKKTPQMREKPTPEIKFYSPMNESMIDFNKKKKTKLLDPEEVSRLYKLEEEAKEKKKLPVEKKPPVKKMPPEKKKVEKKRTKSEANPNKENKKLKKEVQEDKRPFTYNPQNPSMNPKEENNNNWPYNPNLSSNIPPFKNNPNAMSFPNHNAMNINPNNPSTNSSNYNPFQQNSNNFKNYNHPFQSNDNNYNNNNNVNTQVNNNAPKTKVFNPFQNSPFAQNKTSLSNSSNIVNNTENENNETEESNPPNRSSVISNPFLSNQSSSYNYQDKTNNNSFPNNQNVPYDNNNNDNNNNNNNSNPNIHSSYNNYSNVNLQTSTDNFEEKKEEDKSDFQNQYSYNYNNPSNNSNNPNYNTYGNTNAYNPNYNAYAYVNNNFSNYSYNNPNDNVNNNNNSNNDYDNNDNSSNQGYDDSYKKTTFSEIDQSRLNDIVNRISGDYPLSEEETIQITTFLKRAKLLNPQLDKQLYLLDDTEIDQHLLEVDFTNSLWKKFRRPKN